MKKNICMICFLALFFSCKGLDLKKKPSAHLEDVAISGITFKDLTLEYDIRIDNPYPVGLKLDGMEVSVFIEDKLLAKSMTFKGLKIRASGSKTSTYRTVLRYTDLAGIVRDYAKKSYLNCRADIKIMIPLPDLPGLQKNITLSMSVKRKLPTIKPSVSLSGFRLGKPEISYRTGDIKVKAVYDIEVKNNTPSPVRFSSISYGLKFNNRTIGSGESQSLEQNGSKSVLRIENVLSSKKLGKSLIQMILSGKASYELTGNTAVKLPGDLQKKPLNLDFSTRGGLK